MSIKLLSIMVLLLTFSGCIFNTTSEKSKTHFKQLPIEGIFITQTVTHEEDNYGVVTSADTAAIPDSLWSIIHRADVHSNVDSIAIQNDSISLHVDSIKIRHKYVLKQPWSNDSTHINILPRSSYGQYSDEFYAHIPSYLQMVKTNTSFSYNSCIDLAHNDGTIYGDFTVNFGINCSELEALEDAFKTYVYKAEAPKSRSSTRYYVQLHINWE